MPANLHEAAVVYALDRVVQDVDFRYYMLGTESLRLLLLAEAERRGVDVETVNGELASRMDGRKVGAPEVVELRERLERVEHQDDVIDQRRTKQLQRVEARARNLTRELLADMLRGKIELDHSTEQALRMLSDALGIPTPCLIV